MPNFVSFAASVAELAHGENDVLNLSIIQASNQSITHPAYLMPRKPKLSLRKNTHKETYRERFIQTPKHYGERKTVERKCKTKEPKIEAEIQERSSVRGSLPPLYQLGLCKLPQQGPERSADRLKVVHHLLHSGRPLLTKFLILAC